MKFYISKNGLTLNNNVVVEITLKHKSYKKHLVVFYDRKDNILSAQQQELWFKPAQFDTQLSVEDVINDARQWAEFKLKEFDPELHDYIVENDLHEIIEFSNVQSFKVLCDLNDEQELARKEKARKEQVIQEKWEQYPRISKPLSRELPLDIDNLPLETKNELLPLIIAYTTPTRVKFILLQRHKECTYFLEYKHVTEIPSGIPIIRGWWEEGRGYSGGHTSNASHDCTPPTPHRDASYYYDTSWEGNVSGCHPSMLSF